MCALHENAHPEVDLSEGEISWGFKIKEQPNTNLFILGYFVKLYTMLINVFFHLSEGFDFQLPHNLWKLLQFRNLLHATLLFSVSFLKWTYLLEDYVMLLMPAFILLTAVNQNEWKVTFTWKITVHKKVCAIRLSPSMCTKHGHQFALCIFNKLVHTWRVAFVPCCVYNCVFLCLFARAFL